MCRQAYGTIPDNALRHFRDDADASRHFRRAELGLIAYLGKAENVTAWDVAAGLRLWPKAFPPWKSKD